MKTLCLAVPSSLLLLLSAPAFAQSSPAAADTGVVMPTPIPACLSPLEKLGVLRAFGRYEKTHGYLPGPNSFAATKFSIWPMGGNLKSDLIVQNFVDLDPASGLRDYRCGAYTYNGHTGVDCDLRSFAEQDIGVPVFSILDGRVIGTADGHFDRHTKWVTNAKANYVIVDHGGGVTTSYWHLRKGSVAVKVGNNVRAGQQLGLVASSGWSSGPHLHFEVQVNRKSVETFTGACNKGASMWTRQPDAGFTPWVSDVGVTRVSPKTWKVMPERWPGGGWISKADAQFSIWIGIASLPAKSTYRLRYRNPNGAVAWTESTYNFNNTTVFPSSRWYFTRNLLSGMKTTTGRWTIEFELNGKVVATAPILVTSGSAPTNRAPKPIKTTLDPAVPTSSGPIFCRVAPMLVRDEDYDVVRYRYTWYVSGKSVRDVTHAGEADALPKGVALGGDLVQCVVRPGDGKTIGGPVDARAIVQPSPWKDLGFAKKGRFGTPTLESYGSLVTGRQTVWSLQRAQHKAPMFWIGSVARIDAKIFGGTLVPSTMIMIPAATDLSGSAVLATNWPAGIPKGTRIYCQAWIGDNTASYGFSASNAMQGTTQ